MKLSIRNLNKHYGQKHALIDFHAELQEGVYGLLGANGAGKSTLMGILTETLPPDPGGEIQLTGRASLRQSLGYMPQQQELYGDFSARGFLYYVAALKGIRRPGDQVERVLEAVHLCDVAHQRIGAFSGGMKQRVLLAQALLGDPDLLLLDEPTAGLDPMERIRIRNYISTISGGKIVILATHVVSDIEYIARQVIILREGRLLGIRHPAEWIEEANGHVFEAIVQEEALSRYERTVSICNVSREQHGIRIRFVADTAPEGALPVRPTLEDVYLYTQIL